MLQPLVIRYFAYEILFQLRRKLKNNRYRATNGYKHIKYLPEAL